MKENSKKPKINLMKFERNMKNFLKRFINKSLNIKTLFTC